MPLLWKRAVAVESCLYEGRIRHRRFGPIARCFSYRLFMAYLDLDELPDLFEQSWLFSARRWAPAQFRRRDHLGDPDLPLPEAVRGLVVAQTGVRPAGPIRLLTHLRYFGYCFNPVSFYYCFNSDGDEPETVLAEVNNTPWGEQHTYLLNEPEAPSSKSSKRYRFAKRLHVSPFMEMDMEYQCVLGYPRDRLVIHMENWRDSGKLFDATLSLRRIALTKRALLGQLVRFPFMTQRIILAIYWQALLLWLRRIPYVPHPGNLTDGKRKE